MSSVQLSLSSTTQPLPVRTPVHMSFSPVSDVLAILWESGYVELWSLQTRLGPGPGKIMSPSRVFSGVVGEGYPGVCRQIMLHERNSSTSAISLVVLRSDCREYDVFHMAEVDGGAFRRLEAVALPGRNGRFVSCRDAVVWQGSRGQLFEG